MVHRSTRDRAERRLRKGSLGAFGFPFLSAYWEDGGEQDKFLRLSGFERFPVFAPRWDFLQLGHIRLRSGRRVHRGTTRRSAHEARLSQRRQEARRSAHARRRCLPERHNGLRARGDIFRLHERHSRRKAGHSRARHPAGHERAARRHKRRAAGDTRELFRGPLHDGLERAGQGQDGARDCRASRRKALCTRPCARTAL